jgi:hypothetical protein
MKVSDIVRRVQAKVDDLEGTYCDYDYVVAFMPDVLDWIYAKLRLINYDFDEERVILPAVAAGTPDLGDLQQDGQPLAGLIQPRIVEWKLPGLDNSYFARADGPLDEVRDLPNNVAFLDSWAYKRGVLTLSLFSTALDLRVTGDFLFTAMTDPDDQITISNAANRVFSCKLASEIGKARSQDKFVVNYGADADEALDDLAIALTKSDQSKTRRLGRINRSNQGTIYSNPRF